MERTIHRRLARHRRACHEQIALVQGQCRAHDGGSRAPPRAGVRKPSREETAMGGNAVRRPWGRSFSGLKRVPSEGTLEFQFSHYREDGLRPNIRQIFCVL